MINLGAADRREDAVLHLDALHVRNPGRGTHGNPVEYDDWFMKVMKWCALFSVLCSQGYSKSSATAC